MSKAMNALGALGLGIAAVAGTVNIALYNGMSEEIPAIYSKLLGHFIMLVLFSGIGELVFCHLFRED